MQDKQNKQVKDDDDELLQELETNEPLKKKKKKNPPLNYLNHLKLPSFHLLLNKLSNLGRG
jgi:hypothetical protein